MKLVDIQGNTKHFQKNLVKSIEDLLKLAKEGKIETAFIGTLQTDGEIKTCQFSVLADEETGMLKRLGLIEILKQDLVNDFNERNDG